MNGQLIISNWAAHASTEDSGSITLAAGQSYAVVLEYFNAGGAGTAVLTYASRAGEKLREQASLTSSVMVFVRTNPFKDVPQYAKQIVVPLPHPTDDTLLIGRAVAAGLKAIYRQGFK